MKLSFISKCLIGFLVAAFLLFLCCGWISYLRLYAHVSLAEEQTLYFEESIQQAVLQRNPEKVTEYIDGIKTYYASGTKQRIGSHLDLMVERSRALSIAFLEHFRSSLTNTNNQPKN